MKSMIALAAAFLALTGLPAEASQTACVFEGGEASHYYELEFIGYDDVSPTIVFSSTAFGSGKRITLQPGNYSLKEFSRKKSTLHLEFRNPGNDSLPPSFSLTSQGSRSQLKIGSSIIDGTLYCDD